MPLCSFLDSGVLNRKVVVVPYQPALPEGARLNTSLALEAQLSNVRLNCRTLLQREILKVGSFLL